MIGWVLGLLSLGMGLRQARRHRLVTDLPTSKTQGVFIGLTELKGLARCEAPLTSTLSETRCVWYQFTVEEHWMRTETVRGSDGKMTTRTRSGWDTVRSSTEGAPFYLEDDTGVLRVLPEGAETTGDKVYSHQCGRMDPIYYAHGPQESVHGSTHERRFREHAIPIGAEVYTVGRARVRDDVVAAEIAAFEGAAMFLISTRSEEEVATGMRRWFIGLTLAGLLALAGALAVLQFGYKLPVPTDTWAIHGAGYLGALALGWVWMAFNSLVGLRERVDLGWSQIDIQLKRRADLIPGLVSCLKALKEHEADVQTTVAALRNQADVTTDTPDGVAGVARQVKVVGEAHPELKANTTFQKLMEELSDTESRIALARGYFNDIATHFNTRLEVVPDRFVAGLMQMKPRALLSAEGFERANVDVSFVE